MQFSHVISYECIFPMIFATYVACVHKHALSPVPYNIFIADVKVKSCCSLAQFADDTSACYSHNNPKCVMLEASVTRFQKYKINVSDAKTQAIFFTKRKASRFPPSRNLSFHSIKEQNTEDYPQ